MSDHRNTKGRYSRSFRRRHMNVALVVLLDILLAGVILLAFAFSHHALPAMLSELERQETLKNPTELHATEADETELATEGPTAAPTEEETEPPTEPDNRTEWQKKFEDQFSDEVYQDETTYRSPEVSITIETVTTGEGNKQITYHVADIYVGSIENFTAQTAHGELRYFGTQDVVEMSSEANAILAISGDFITYQNGGLLVRNSEVFKATSNGTDICALFPDGTMETYAAREYQVEDILAREPLQVWSFGPELLDENGDVKSKYKVSQAVSYPNPRSAVGYYEPGHYCFVVVDGRQKNYSAGMTIPQLAQLFKDLGCTSAYNLDGGGSAVMVYNGDRYSKQSNGGDRGLGDILVIRDSYYGKEAEE